MVLRGAVELGNMKVLSFDKIEAQSWMDEKCIMVVHVEIRRGIITFRNRR